MVENSLVKLKFLKGFCINSPFMKCSFLGGFWPLIVQIWLDHAEIFTKGSLKEYKNSVWRAFQAFAFYLKQDVPKVYNFVPFLGPIYPRKTKNIAKNQNFFKNCILRTIKCHISHVPEKSQNSRRIKQKKTF